MNLSGLTTLLTDDQAVRDLVEGADRELVVDVVAPPGFRPPVLARISDAGIPVVVVTATSRDAEDLAQALGCWMEPDSVAVFPSWETLPHERLSPRTDTMARRIAVLRRLSHPEGPGQTGPVRVVVLPVRAMLQPVVAGLGDLEPVEISAGDRLDLEEVVERLHAAAYTRVDMVERRGEMAVRGGILDVFPPTEDHPIRVEFWGDTVEELRWFAVADQRSLDVAPRLWAPACRELRVTKDVQDRAANLRDHLPAAADLLDRVAGGAAVEGMESLLPVLVDSMVPLTDLLPEGSLVVQVDPERIRRRVHDLLATSDEFLAAAWSAAAAGASVPLDLSRASFIPLDEIQASSRSRGMRWWTFAPFGLDESHDGLVLTCREPEHYRGDVDRAVADLRHLQETGWRVVVATDGAGPGQRMVEQLRDAQVPAQYVVESELLGQPGVVGVVSAPIGRGFLHDGLRLAVVAESDLTGRSGSSTKDMRRMPHRRRNTVDPLTLRPGDHVVHEQHGVGKFVELVARTVGSGSTAATREYLVIEYASSKRGQPGDRLFVPTDALDQVTKYVGGESPTLSRMGGADWARTKGRARKAVREIAGELIRLYSARMATPGRAFGADTPWQRELEDAFAFIETPDQLVTIDEVKADMEKPVPMDRLICGDVGYGKTEIAVRAAFKAVQEGTQVAVLVPTTLLVTQHLETFTERYAPFPVTVRALSRFQSDAEARAVMDGLSDGSIDVVIGTHRLLTGQVRFKNLGLVVVDEEQRFGVEHKESLKALRADVDVLSMSATPIPRTLEMAVTGIREMSTLATPPEERHPVLTFVGPYDEAQISAAIRRELLRDGQLFYVHNTVASINRAAARLAELVPEARIAVAHGKMPEHQLEQVMVDFWEKRFDVLVSTTIIETGLDISNANTLILERADLLGLSQLHQLRGRVGRGRERAYAYFLYPGQTPLTETAHDRLATIAANTDLGSGMAVAMKDLEIRGAGNLLGGEQSGHIEGVGFDLYVRMVGEAVAEFRGDVEPEQPDVTVELPVDAHIPHNYISTERLRLEAYRRIAMANDSAALEEVRAELLDRYGLLPAPVGALFDVAGFRHHARRAGLTDVTMQGRYVRFAPVELAESAGLRLNRLYPGTVYKPVVRTALVPFPTTARVGGRPLHGQELLAWAGQLIDAVLFGDVSAAATVSTR